MSGRHGGRGRRERPPHPPRASRARGSSDASAGAELSSRRCGGGVTRRAAACAFAAVVLLAAAGCDNVVKHMPWFSTMTDGPGVETYEQRPVPPPEGAVPVEGTAPSFPVPVADTTSALRNPLSGTEEELARGEELYVTFCLPCHGPQGRGRGPVVNHDGEHPGRLPAVPTVDLTSGTGPDRSDGYIWGMIENGRPPLMPDYSRIPHEDRWYIVEYVRHLQRQAGAEPVRGAAGPTADASGGAATTATASAGGAAAGPRGGGG